MRESLIAGDEISTNGSESWISVSKFPTVSKPNFWRLVHVLKEEIYLIVFNFLQCFISLFYRRKPPPGWGQPHWRLDNIETLTHPVSRRARGRRKVWRNWFWSTTACPSGTSSISLPIHYYDAMLSRTCRGGVLLQEEHCLSVCPLLWRCVIKNMS